MSTPAIPPDMPVKNAIAHHGAEAVARAITEAISPEARSWLNSLTPAEAEGILRAALGLPLSIASAAATLPNSRYPKITGHCYGILSRLRNNAWTCSAPCLNDVGGLNYRARISDLRHVFGIDIQADPAHPAPGQFSLYHVPAQSRPRAEHLLLHGTLENYHEAPRQTSLL